MKTPSNFRCNRCGSCCLSPFLSKKDIEKIKKLGYQEDYFVEQLDSKRFMKNIDGKCIFLKKGRITECRIYNARPKTCIKYPSEIRDNGDCKPEVLAFDKK